VLVASRSLPVLHDTNWPRMLRDSGKIKDFSSDGIFSSPLPISKGLPKLMLNPTQLNGYFSKESCALANVLSTSTNCSKLYQGEVIDSPSYSFQLTHPVYIFTNGQRVVIDVGQDGKPLMLGSGSKGYIYQVAGQLIESDQGGLDFCKFSSRPTGVVLTETLLSSCSMAHKQQQLQQLHKKYQLDKDRLGAFNLAIYPAIHPNTSDVVYMLMDQVAGVTLSVFLQNNPNLTGDEQISLSMALMNAVTCSNQSRICYVDISQNDIIVKYNPDTSDVLKAFQVKIVNWTQVISMEAGNVASILNMANIVKCIIATAAKSKKNQNSIGMLPQIELMAILTSDPNQLVLRLARIHHLRNLIVLTSSGSVSHCFDAQIQENIKKINDRLAHKEILSDVIEKFLSAPSNRSNLLDRFHDLPMWVETLSNLNNTRLQSLQALCYGNSFTSSAEQVSNIKVFLDASETFERDLEDSSRLLIKQFGYHQPQYRDKLLLLLKNLASDMNRIALVVVTRNILSINDFETALESISKEKLKFAILQTDGLTGIAAAVASEFVIYWFCQCLWENSALIEFFGSALIQTPSDLEKILNNCPKRLCYKKVGVIQKVLTYHKFLNLIGQINTRKTGTGPGDGGGLKGAIDQQIWSVTTLKLLYDSFKHDVVKETSRLALLVVTDQDLCFLLGIFDTKKDQIELMACTSNLTLLQSGGESSHGSFQFCFWRRQEDYNGGAIPLIKVENVDAAKDYLVSIDLS